MLQRETASETSFWDTAVLKTGISKYFVSMVETKHVFLICRAFFSLGAGSIRMQSCQREGGLE